MRIFMNGATECAVVENDDRGNALIKLTNNPATPYVVVWGYSEDASDWCGGSYYEFIKDAVDDYAARGGRWDLNE